MTPDITRPRASERERYELLYSQVKDCFDGLVDYEFRHATILLVFTGWLVTAEHAQSTLARYLPVTIGAIVMALALSLGHTMWAIHQYRRSAAAFQSLSELDYMPMEHIRPRMIGKGLVASFCLLHGLASVVICVIIWSFSAQWLAT
jgi:hypothetical protein